MSIGPWQIALIVLLVLVIFGAGRLPTMMRDLARGIRTFKQTLLDQDESDGEAGKTRRIRRKPPSRKSKPRSSKKP